MVEIDGSRYSGSGTIVRQAVALAALTGEPVRIANIRVKRPKPGLQRQHAQVVRAMAELVGGETEGVHVGARELVFRPGPNRGAARFAWDIGSAGSTTLLALAVLPVLAFRPGSTEIEVRGGLFQDFAPSFFHFRDVLLPLVRRMGLRAQAQMERPGYVPRGGGVLRLRVEPVAGGLRPVMSTPQGEVRRVWGIALASRLAEREVGQRMARAAQRALATAGYQAGIEVLDDRTALQPGAALALFADLDDDVRLGADGAGAPGRPSEAIGERAARDLLEDLASGATLDRHAADQVIPFAALAAGESRFRVPAVTEHLESGAWLAREFLGAEVDASGAVLRIRGVGFSPRE